MNEQQFEEFMVELKSLVNSVAEIAAAFEAEIVLPDDTIPPTVPPILDAGLIEVFVTADKSPLREITGQNRKGVDVLGIYGKSISERIVAPNGAGLIVYPEVLTFDGGEPFRAYKLISSQRTGGKQLPHDQWLYVLARHVTVK